MLPTDLPIHINPKIPDLLVSWDSLMFQKLNLVLIGKEFNNDFS